MSDQHLESWGLSTDAWRLSSTLNLRYVNAYMRALGAHRIPAAMVSRLYTLGIPPEIVHSTLKSIRQLDKWSSAWVETAQHYLGNYRREISAGNRIEAERARYLAAMSYHAAQILEVSDLRTRNNCRAWAASLARQSLPARNQNARHFTIPWRDQELPVLFEVPEFGDGPFGLVILLNGVSQSKEETFQWAPRFLQAGFAVMAVDSPGTGEATALGPISANTTDILDGVFDLLRHESIIDLSRVALVGASLGGNEAVRIARKRPDIMAIVTVTPALEPANWLDHASPMLVAELSDLAAPDGQASLAAEFGAMAAAEAIQQPALIFGAGRDLVVPPNESQRLAEILGERATYVWYPELGHCLYVAADQWTYEAATWLAAVGEGRTHGITDAALLAEAGKTAIESSAYMRVQASADDWDDDDIGEYARLIPADEIDS